MTFRPQVVNAALCKVLIASSVSVVVVFVLGICCEIWTVRVGMISTANTAARLVESMMIELVGSVPLYISTYLEVCKYRM